MPPPTTQDLTMASHISLFPGLFSPMDQGNYQHAPQRTTTTNTFSSSGSDNNVEGTEFEVSDYLSFDPFEDWGIVGERSEPTGFEQNESFGYQGSEFSSYELQGNEFNYSLGGTSDNQHEGESSRSSRNSREKDAKGRVAFKMRSEVEVLDDGYKWRKYGKKMVKNSPNPRNYYRCSVEGCPVKKRIERDREDPSYVVTTYDGCHNHETPGQ